MFKNASLFTLKALVFCAVASVGLVNAAPAGHSVLRNNPINVEPPAPIMPKTIEKEGGFDRSFAEQPPMIPHGIRGYQQDKNANFCLMCHSPENAKKWKATAVPASHLKTEADGKLVVANNRYFCLQCHVPQADAKPLLKNNFKGAEAQK